MEEKCVKMQNPALLWAETRRVYRYRLGGTGTGMQRSISTGTARTGTGTTCSSSPVLTYFRTVKSRIRVPMFRDPKK